MEVILVDNCVGVSIDMLSPYNGVLLSLSVSPRGHLQSLYAGLTTFVLTKGWLLPKFKYLTMWVFFLNILVLTNPPSLMTNLVCIQDGQNTLILTSVLSPGPLNEREAQPYLQ